MAYLLSAMLVKPGEKLALLMHNTLLKDLQAENTFTKIIALSMLRYFFNEDLIRDATGLVRKLLKDKLGAIRRKSYLVMFNIYQLYPR